MGIEITEFVNVRQRLEELGCSYPESGMALLPSNLESAKSASELMQAAEAATIRKLLFASGLPLSDVRGDGNQRLPAIKNKHFEWTAPILFITSALYSDNPALVSLALNVISSYAYDFFKGIGGKHDVKFEVVVEASQHSTTRRISYTGPVEGLKDLPGAIKEALR